jgi:hypothetical protein
MNKRLVFMVMLLNVLVFLSFTACSKGPAINSIETLTKYLASSNQNTADKPHTITLVLGYGTDLEEVVNIIKNFGRYVNLDLSKSIELTSIGVAFSECTTLTGITIPSNVTSIDVMAFSGCTALTSVTTGNGVTSINAMAFSGCTALTSVTIGNSVTSINAIAFYECTSLTRITIPRNVTSIATGAFYGCTALTSITVDANNPNYTSDGGILFDKAKTSLIQAPQGISGNVTIPASVTSIGEAAFAECTALTSVTIGNSVTSIGESAFSMCTALTSITIPDSVVQIGDYAFNNNPLISVTIGPNVKFEGGGYSSSDAFPRSFVRAYNGVAGTYTRPDANSQTWTRN